MKVENNDEGCYEFYPNTKAISLKFQILNCKLYHININFEILNSKS